MISASDDIGRYFIYLTNWGITLCMITTVLGAILVAVWYYHPEYSGKFICIRVEIKKIKQMVFTMTHYGKLGTFSITKLPCLWEWGNLNGACKICNFLLQYSIIYTFHYSWIKLKLNGNIIDWLKGKKNYIFKYLIVC